MKKISIILSLIFIFSLSLSAESIWRDEFDEIKHWYDNNADSSFGAVIKPGKKKSTADVIQKGNSSWGKIAFVVTDIDLNKFKYIRLKVNKVSKSGDYKIIITDIDWKNTFTVIDRGEGKGIHDGDIKKITGWSGKKTFNVVIIIEGKKKKVTLDWIEITDKKK